MTPPPARWYRTWFVHLRIVHPACLILRRLGLRKWAFRLHDATVPDWRGHLWDWQDSAPAGRPPR